jgi:hypothetical protein
METAKSDGQADPLLAATAPPVGKKGETSHMIHDETRDDVMRHESWQEGKADPLAQAVQKHAQITSLKGGKARLSNRA